MSEYHSLTATGAGLAAENVMEKENRSEQLQIVRCRSLSYQTLSNFGVVHGSKYRGSLGHVLFPESVPTGICG